MKRTFEWAYVIAAIGAFVFFPEVRRIVDWRIGFSAIDILQIVPTLMLLPIAFWVIRGRRTLTGSSFGTLLFIWLLGCTYAFLVAVVYRQSSAGAFGFSQFALPAFVGAWLFMQRDDLETKFDRLAKPLLLFASVAGAYGIYQYIAAPAWDTAWMDHIGADSFGQPEAFGIRVFSVLNSPGPFAIFITIAILFNLPSLSVTRIFQVPATLLCIAGSALSLVRSAWLALVVGVFVFVMLSPQRLRVLSALAVSVAFVTSLGIVFFGFMQYGEAQEALSQRFTTFSDIEEDTSAEARRQTASDALSAAFAGPAGTGLGTTGVGYKLVGDSSANTAVLGDIIDEGYVSRFLEMGVPGFIAVLFVLVGSAMLALRTHRRLMILHLHQAATINAAMFAVQVSLLVMLFYGDDLSGLTAVLYFCAAALPASAAREHC